MINFEHKSFEEQIDIFKQRNLKFQNPERAKETLSKISYYKIKEFAKPLAIIQKTELLCRF